eukprot:PhF_6_TR34981/c0_g1_i3/m.50816/K05655/ABCB8; ATP-binding cassette, subfamily B (MDR/TAP), member 8
MYAIQQVKSLRSSTIIVLGMITSPVVLLAYRYHASRDHRKYAELSWESKTLVTLQELKEESGGSSSTRDALIDVLDKGERLHVSRKNKIWIECVQHLAQAIAVDIESTCSSLPSILRDESIRQIEDTLRQFPEVYVHLPKDVRMRLFTMLNKARRSRRWALFRYLCTENVAKFVTYGLVIGVSVIRSKLKLKSMIQGGLHQETVLLIAAESGWSMETLSTFWRVVEMHALSLLVDTVCEGFTCRLTQFITERYRNQQKMRFYTKIFGMDTTYFDTHTAEDVEAMSYYIHDLEGVDTQLHLHLTKVVSTLTKVVLLYRVNPAASILTLVLVGVFKKIQSWSKSKLLPYSRSLSAESTPIGGGSGFLDADGRVITALSPDDVFENIRLLRVMGLEKKLLGLYESDSSVFFSRSLLLRVCADHVNEESLLLLQRLNHKFFNVLALTAAAVTLRTTPTTVVGFVDAVTDVVEHYHALQDIAQLVDSNAYKAHVLLSVFQQSGGIEDSNALTAKPQDPSHTAPLQLGDDIVFSNVCFAYPAQPDRVILNNFSASIPGGKLTVLTGPNGCGKSTITMLLARLYDPCQGTVGFRRSSSSSSSLVDLKTINPNLWRANIGYVPQVSVMFPGTIEFNIRMGREGYSMEDVRHAANVALAHPFISKLPDGYKTKLGPKHTHLSGGQAQRVALTRALLSRSVRLLILDEPTSALDVEGQKEVMKLMLELRDKGMTILCISHDQELVECADHILRMGPH